MRFGIFYEHQLPRPWNENSEQQLISDALEQVELADKVGIDYVWEVEHHFLEEYSHSSASEVFLAACSQRTKQIRLGHGIVAMPPGYQHPARVAEKISMLDLVSQGRVEWGTGETSSGTELEGFGVHRDSKRDQWEEAVEIAARMMVEEPFAGVDGKFVKMPPRNVVPKPVQKPHPPIWVACSRRDTIKMAAEKGIGALSFSFVEPEEAAEWVAEYYSIIQSERCKPIGFNVNPNVAVVLPMMLHKNEQTAIDRGIDGAHFFGYSLAHYYVFGEHRPGRTNIWEEFQQNRANKGFSREVITADDGPLGVKILSQGFGSLRGAIGTPDQVAELIERYERAGVDQVIFCLQAGKNQHEHIMEAIELFGKKVLPRFKKRADSAQQQKLQQLQPAIEAALARRKPPEVFRDENYVIKPMGSGPEPRHVGGGAVPNASAAKSSPAERRRAGKRRAALRRTLREKGTSGFQGFVKSSDNQRLEKTVASERGLKFIFAGMQQRFRPDRAGDFTGEIQYTLIGGEGTRQHYTIEVRDGAAKFRVGAAHDPKLTITLAATDFVRIAAEELDPITLMFDGKLEMAGDYTVAQKLPEMFGAARS